MILLEDIEFEAFIGLSIFSGVNTQKHQPVNKLWKPSGFAMYRASIIRDRFIFLLKFIRFGNIITRAIRMVEDKAAQIRDILGAADNKFGHEIISAQRHHRV